MDCVESKSPTIIVSKLSQPIPDCYSRVGEKFLWAERFVELERSWFAGVEEEGHSLSVLRLGTLVETHPTCGEGDSGSRLDLVTAVKPSSEECE